VIPSLLTLVLEAALRALIAGLAVWAALRLLRVKNLIAEKAAWGLVLLAAIAMPLLMRWQWVPGWAFVKIPAMHWVRSAETAPKQAAVEAVPAASTHVARTSAEPMVNRHILDQTETLDDGVSADFDSGAPMYSEAESAPTRNPAATGQTTTPKISARFGMLSIGWIVYLAVAALLLTRLLWGLVCTLRLWRRAKPAAVHEICDFPASIQVCWSERIASPVNIGSGVLLPADFVEWSEEKLRVVLEHERSHIEQHDFHLQLLAGIYAALTWFSPLGWWLKRTLSELGEAISDRAGMSAATSPSAYAGLLLEFAALPRPNLTGVAMAHSKNLSHRIERLLNESSSHHVPASGRRVLLAIALPALLIAATAMVRVEAAGAQQTAPSQPTITGQSNPEPAQVTDSSPAQTPAVPAPQAAPAPEAAPVPSPAPVPAPSQEASQAPAPAPANGDQESMPAMAPMLPVPPVHVDVHIPPMLPMMAYAGRWPCFANGEGYAIVGDQGTKVRFCGDWDNEGKSDVDKARAVAHGHFLLFRQNGKLYVVDDPATVSQIEEMDKSREALRDQMRALGKQMRDAGQQAREAALKAHEAAVNVPAPDLSKEMAELESSVASLKDKQGGTISREQLQEIQREAMAIQRRVMEAEVKVNINLEMSEFRKHQGEFGAQMGRLGAQMGQTERENNQKIQSIIKESLQNGKAKPVQ
jgi:bla regulator protein blaR1